MTPKKFRLHSLTPSKVIVRSDGTHRQTYRRTDRQTRGFFFCFFELHDIQDMHIHQKKEIFLNLAIIIRTLSIYFVRDEKVKNLVSILIFERGSF